MRRRSANRPGSETGTGRAARLGRKPVLAGLAAAGVLAGSLLYLGAIGGRDGREGETGDRDGYLGGAACAGCHAGIAEEFLRSGMGRSFVRMTDATAIADFEDSNEFLHAASSRHYRMWREDGSYFMRRWQVGSDGREENVVERRIDYAVGSGFKARTYLSRTESGELLQLPVGWYSERGGFWAMNPGYDRPDHDGFRRRVQHDCMFCHNAYPEFEPGRDRFDADPIVFGGLPEGIDCERCHGPGRRHVEAAAASAPAPRIRSAIVNPARLPPERRLETCLQCHLQSTSTRLPYAVERAGRGVYSYRPGEPLADYVVHFDHATGTGRDDKFEIAHAAYRLLRSACFRKSGGAVTCTDCHDPHRPLRTDRAADRDRYRRACEACHGEEVRALARDGRHTESGNCAGCHMPLRRTEDVVHVVMTDHRIQRPPRGGSLVAPRRERPETAASAYAGEIVPYYPANLPTDKRDELDIAVAQVRAGANLADGIRRLTSLLAGPGAHAPRYYFELGDAMRRAGLPGASLEWYERARERSPRYVPGMISHGIALAQSGRLAEAESTLRDALGLAPRDSRALHNLGLVLLRGGQAAGAADALRRACEIKPDASDSWNALGSALHGSGDAAGAERAFREAVRIQPDLELARANLASLLAAAGRHEEAGALPRGRGEAWGR